MSLVRNTDSSPRYTVYCPDTEHGSITYTQRQFASIQELARWAVDAALTPPPPVWKKESGRWADAADTLRFIGRTLFRPAPPGSKGPHHATVLWIVRMALADPGRWGLEIGPTEHCHLLLASEGYFAVSPYGNPLVPNDSLVSEAQATWSSIVSLGRSPVEDVATQIFTSWLAREPTPDALRADLLRSYIQQTLLHPDGTLGRGPYLLPRIMANYQCRLREEPSQWLRWATDGTTEEVWRTVLADLGLTVVDGQLMETRLCTDELAAAPPWSIDDRGAPIEEMDDREDDCPYAAFEPTPET